MTVFNNCSFENYLMDLGYTQEEYKNIPKEEKRQLRKEYEEYVNTERNDYSQDELSYE